MNNTKHISDILPEVVKNIKQPVNKPEERTPKHLQYKGWKKDKILDYAKKHGSITYDKAVQLIGWSYYCNERQHVSSILKRAVNNNELQRVKRGVYKPAHKAALDSDPNQLSIF